MRSTFLGFEIAKSGVQAAQSGLDVTGQNISKMNSKGYSRQTIDQSSVYYASTSYKFALVNQNDFGHGVTVDRITQMRDQFLDSRYREYNSQYSEYSKALSIMTSIDNFLDETLTDGLGVAYEDFLANLQTFARNTGDIDYSGLVRTSAQKITDTLSYYYNQLETIKEQEITDLGITINDINTLVDKIEKLNTSIQFEQVLGNTTNDLLDTRNLYLDELSEYLEITVEPNSDGTINIKVGSEYLLDAVNNTKQMLSVSTSGGETIIEGSGSGELTITSGSVKAYLDALNGKGAYAVTGENKSKGIPYFQQMLDDFANAFATTMNNLNGTEKPLFTGTTALTIEVSDAWMQDANYITTTTSPTPKDGNNDNILKMLATLNSDIAISSNFTGTFDEFISKMMMDAGSEENNLQDLKDNAGVIFSSLNNQREAVKGVSLNEETVNILKYQKAFEASSRILTALDEMLDTIINRMGTVGR
jgi:flagellar hook-associated protein 1 FlgK